jgi:hypothetical protein
MDRVQQLKNDFEDEVAAFVRFRDVRSRVGH